MKLDKCHGTGAGATAFHDLMWFTLVLLPPPPPPNRALCVGGCCLRQTKDCSGEIQFFFFFFFELNKSEVRGDDEFNERKKVMRFYLLVFAR